MQTILLLGGAGFVGSAVAHELLVQGYGVVIVDLFLHKQTVTLPGAIIIKSDFGDEEVLRAIFSAYHISAVMHFAAYIEVGRSVHEPALFYENNVIKTKRLLDVMREYNVTKLVFSSSCAIYAPLQTLEKLTEQHAINPLSPYGKTKLTIEFLLQDYAQAYGLSYVSLRYFNAAGALSHYHLGEQHDPETHVIPLLFKACEQGALFTLYGDDYPTPDGACVRDYIHVSDLSSAHCKALSYLNAGGSAMALNLGSGVGYSVKELIAVVAAVCGQSIKVIVRPRRTGDAPLLVADTTLAERTLGWHAHATLEQIVRDAWCFFQNKHIKQLKNNGSGLNLENS
ncbi:UDP-glucose 4-epimerase GalE [Candidatus Dependentiae bacterium]|nr:UDP-glucose 4-epimerase GalE [Candidatus Dependentiae bacterium]